MTYQSQIDALDRSIRPQGESWNAINPEAAARMRLQNRFGGGLDIARYTAVFSCIDWSGKGPNSLRSAATIQPER